MTDDEMIKHLQAKGYKVHPEDRVRTFDISIAIRKELLKMRDDAKREEAEYLADRLGYFLLEKGALVIEEIEDPNPQFARIRVSVCIVTPKEGA